ncbi:MAG: hypothetical protein Q4G27_06725 [Flavobacteriaceae bacterium]|nr:hypothetical protein [Flavobacteriaceae bacterium]
MKKPLLTTLTIFIFTGAFAQQKWNYPPTPKIPVYDKIWGEVIQDDDCSWAEVDSPLFLNHQVILRHQ